MKDMLLDVIDEDEIITCKEIARRVGLKFNDIKFVVFKSSSFLRVKGFFISSFSSVSNLL